MEVRKRTTLDFSIFCSRTLPNPSNVHLPYCCDADVREYRDEGICEEVKSFYNRAAIINELTIFESHVDGGFLRCDAVIRLMPLVLS